MEVADQWRRQWAGTAEYGKVTEGGVTRRIARAMEVLHASAPGARVRVMRAAYHSTAGPGAPTSSYLMQSSRRVISSGYNLPDPLPLPSKPLEVSSLPLESSPDVDNEKINYKVTEPDDLEISEPSKWRNAMGKSPIRMPSEESSSADNASIIDLDSRNNSRNTLTRSFRDSESNEDDIKNIHVRNNRVSPLLDAPVTLSTLKYTSLLNGSDVWNNRRKSYSFEDTTTLNNKGYLRKPDTLVMDSSTDSGICKSTEIVTDNTSNYLENKSRRLSKDLSDLPEESFHDWLYKNRPSPTFKSTRLSPLKDYPRVYPTNENIISLQSKGKVTITLPVMIERDDSNEPYAINTEDNDRKTKRVEFCKTELHFAAESGTVNIIATDEKPPPSNDFKKKKSVFVPFTSKVDKSITLFGEKSNFTDLDINTDVDKNVFNDQDENTAATKSILKNRIPKPKPYLLGENMTFGTSTESYSIKNDTTFPTAVSLINRELQLEEKQRSNLNTIQKDEVNNYSAKTPLRTLGAGPQKNVPSLKKYYDSEKGTGSLHKQQSRDVDNLNKYNPVSLTPILGKCKTRQLKDSDLTYFGVENDKRYEEIQTMDNLQEEILHSVKLVQKISNSVCNSEAESDDSHDYQNISSIKYGPVPTPKPRTKYINVVESNRNMKSLKPILEGEKDHFHGSRKSKLKSTNESTSSLSRNISEQPKKDSRNKLRDSSLKRPVIDSCEQKPKNQGDQRIKHNSVRIKPTELTYVNINPKINIKMKQQSEDRNSNSGKLKVKHDDKHGQGAMTSQNDKIEDMKIKQSSSKYHKPKRTEKLTTPDLSTSRNESNCVGNVKIKNYSLSSMHPHNQSPVQHAKVTKYNNTQPYKKGNLGVTIEESHIGINNSQNIRSRDDNSSKSAKIPKINQSTLKSNETDSKARSSSKTRKTKYVINYDDKNGTVSSVCKIKPNQDSLRRKEASLQHRYPKIEPKIKVTNKSGLLNIPDQQWISNGIKRKSKTHARKSCQLL